MAYVRQSRGLGVVFSMFLGIMVTAFVGVGVYTFYPPPQQFDEQLRELYERKQEIKDAEPAEELTEAEREQIQALDDQRDQLIEDSRLARERWGRNTSIVLITLATLAMAVSLVRADQLLVLSNGLLLGGVLTMLYGIGWIVATDRAISRFVVITLALAITIFLGYCRFVRRQPPSTVVVSSAMPDAEGMAAIEQRLSDLERRLDEAARALGQGER